MFYWEKYEAFEKYYSVLHGLPPTYSIFNELQLSSGYSMTQIVTDPVSEADIERKLKALAKAEAD